MNRITPPLKYPGGKSYQVKKITSHFPQHTTYVEPYAGGLSVLLGKDPEGVSEVVNDIDLELTNFWQVLQDPRHFADFCKRMQVTPFSEVEWTDSMHCEQEIRPGYRSVDEAAYFFVRCRQSLAGRGDSFASISTARTRRGMNEQVSAWLSAVEGLPEVHARLKRVLILNREATEVIQQFDKPGVLQYLDPPYCQDTRASPEVYRFEMTVEQHQELLAVCKGLKHAKVVLSGYRNELYDRELADWNRVDYEQKVHSGGGKKKRVAVESLWMNY